MHREQSFPKDATVRTVRTGELLVSRSVDDVLITYSLASCIGLALYDGEKNIGGLVHCMIPVSTSDPKRAAQQPELFTDSGVTSLLRAVFELGASRSSLVARVSGAASLDGGDNFGIGPRNYAVLRRVLWRNSIFIAGEDIGGNLPRTMSLEMATGRTVVVAGGRKTVF